MSVVDIPIWWCPCMVIYPHCCEEWEPVSRPSTTAVAPHDVGTDEPDIMSQRLAFPSSPLTRTGEPDSDLEDELEAEINAMTNGERVEHAPLAAPAVETHLPQEDGNGRNNDAPDQQRVCAVGIEVGDAGKTASHECTSAKPTLKSSKAHEDSSNEFKCQKCIFVCSTFTWSKSLRGHWPDLYNIYSLLIRIYQKRHTSIFMKNN